MIAFGRILRVTVGPPGGEGRSFGNAEDGTPGHAVEIHTKAADSGSPGEARLVAYNLSGDSIRLFEDSRNVVIVRAGYRMWESGRYTPQTSVIFQGNPAPDGIRYSRNGGDRVLEVLIRDGGRALDHTSMRVSWGSDTSGDQIVEEILRQTGLSRGVIDLGDFQVPRRYVFSGPARRALEDLTRASGGRRRWYVRDGALHIAPKGQGVEELALVLSSENGNLLHAPERQEDGTIKFAAILDPTVRVGSVVKVEARRVDGFYTITGVQFDASNEHGPFDMNLTGVPRA